MLPRGLRARAVLPLALPTVLASCALGAYLSPQTALERRVNGLYEGIGVGGTGRVPYRLTLTIQQREGRATAVLVNDESRKAYAGSGTFQATGDGGALELKFFENGDQHRANLHATVIGTKVSGTLRTVLLGRELLGYVVELNKVSDSTTVPATTAPVPQPAPTPAVP
ncbi:hypothetical protein HNQ07_000916 [Deinococcus metalli]|nr:hypothetical protein [Deinococcus metalli]MBB5375472.1 hypothetical protein [Deinococcus metalli]